MSVNIPIWSWDAEQELTDRNVMFWLDGNLVGNLDFVNSFEDLHPMSDTFDPHFQ